MTSKQVHKDVEYALAKNFFDIIMQEGLLHEEEVKHI